MADYSGNFKKIAQLLGVDLSNVDSSKANEANKIIEDLNAQSKKTTQATGAITNTSLKSITEQLGRASSATLSWNNSLFDVTDSFGVLIKTMSNSESSAFDVFAAIQNIIQPLIDLDQALRTKVNKELGVSGRLSEDIRMSIVNTAKETIKYGINVDEIANAYDSFATSLGRAVPLSNELMANITKQARASGMSMSAAGDFLAKLENYGLSIQSGPKTLEEMSDTARSMGLTTNKFMSYAAENLKMINTLGFDKGVRGFTEIAAKASSVGFNLQTAASSAEKLFDIDSAVEMAAQLNVLGGDFGRLGNAIDLMFMPTNDMEGFTDGLMKATQQFVTFNEEKNTFDVSPLDLRRAREFAKATGMSLEEVIETGKRMSKMELIKDRISFIPNLSDEERDLIGSLGQLNDSGEVTIKGETISKLEDEGRLTGAINSLKQQDAQGNRTQEDILSEQLNTMVQSNLYLKGIALSAGAFGEGGGLLTLLGDDLNKLARETLVGKDKDIDFQSIQTQLVSGLADSFRKGSTTEGFESAFSEVFDNADGSVKQRLSTLRTQIEEYMGASVVKSKGDGFAAALSEGSDIMERRFNIQTVLNPHIFIDKNGNVLTRDQRKFVDEEGIEWALRVEEGDTTTVVGNRND